MLFGVPGLKRIAIAIAVLVAGCVGLISCGSYGSSSGSNTSGLQFRAFVSNPLRPLTGGGTAPVLEIVDAQQDRLSGFAVNLSGVSVDPGLLALFPNKRFTLVFSALGNTLTVVNNSQESVSPAGIALPDVTESMFVAPDNLTGYAAVRNAPVVGQQPGAVEVLDLNTAQITATLPVPNVHYVVQSHNGNRILAFGDNQDTVTVIAPSLIGTNTEPRTLVCPDGTPAPQYDATQCVPNPPVRVFDRPVWGLFSSDDTTAYIVNCGAQCGGAVASITVLDLSTNTAAVTVPVDAATIGLLSGTTLYVAGTLSGTACTSGTAATSCGTLSVVDLGAMAVTATAEITDGYHGRMEMGSNGQLFIGARACTNINIPPSGNDPGEVRGCLSIFNTRNSEVVIPPNNGDVTGLEPVANRNVVYLVQDGELRIYDTTTDQKQSRQVDVIGQAVDVKVVDF